MSRRNKLQKFAEVFNFPNVYQSFDLDKTELLGPNREVFELKGNWHKTHFKNENPITLELACGRGEYTNLLASMYPERNFIGVDIKGARIWLGAKNAIEQKLTNAAYLRTKIERINYYFEKGEVDEIWITFPDPFLKKGKSNRRLTARRFLESYREILKPGGIVHLKTDNDVLFEFSEESVKDYEHAEILYSNWDIYSKPLIFKELEGKTYYENMHLAKGITIKYLRFQFK